MEDSVSVKTEIVSQQPETDSITLESKKTNRIETIFGSIPFRDRLPLAIGPLLAFFFGGIFAGLVILSTLQQKNYFCGGILSLGPQCFLSRLLVPDLMRVGVQDTPPGANYPYYPQSCTFSWECRRLDCIRGICGGRPGSIPGQPFVLNRAPGQTCLFLSDCLQLGGSIPIRADLKQGIIAGVNYNCLPSGICTRVSTPPTVDNLFIPRLPGVVGYLTEVDNVNDCHFPTIGTLTRSLWFWVMIVGIILIFIGLLAALFGRSKLYNAWYVGLLFLILGFILRATRRTWVPVCPE
jgi:hypothetical protein